MLEWQQILQFYQTWRTEWLGLTAVETIQVEPPRKGSEKFTNLLWRVQDHRNGLLLMVLCMLDFILLALRYFISFWFSWVHLFLNICCFNVTVHLESHKYSQNLFFGFFWQTNRLTEARYRSSERSLKIFCVNNMNET